MDTTIEHKRVSTHKHEVILIMQTEVVLNDLGEILSTHIHSAEIRVPEDMSEDDRKRLSDNRENITRTIVIQAASNLLVSNPQG
jgi:hypothetical protein